MKNKKYDLKNILSRLDIDALNEMQLTAVEENIQSVDVNLLSATGPVKHLTFLLPGREGLNDDNKNTQALKVVPDRELANESKPVVQNMEKE